jgi:hypothetical protein
LVSSRNVVSCTLFRVTSTSPSSIMATSTARNATLTSQRPRTYNQNTQAPTCQQHGPPELRFCCAVAACGRLRFVLCRAPTLAPAWRSYSTKGRCKLRSHQKSALSYLLGLRLQACRGCASRLASGVGLPGLRLETSLQQMVAGSASPSRLAHRKARAGILQPSNGKHHSIQCPLLQKCNTHSVPNSSVCPNTKTDLLQHAAVEQHGVVKHDIR